MKKQLNQEELGELKGGAVSVGAADDVTNTNKVRNCKCYYNNSNGLTNDNEVIGCSCVCRDPIGKPIPDSLQRS